MQDQGIGRIIYEKIEENLKIAIKEHILEHNITRLYGHVSKYKNRDS
jgi:hypothetical protein